MSLWGLINTIFGLGVWAQHSLSDEVSDTINREKAQQTGRSTYSVNGYKERSTVTGRDCSYRDDWDTHHRWLVDAKTGQKIEDLTHSQNVKKTRDNKQKSMEKGWKFYRTAIYDCQPRYWCDIWVNDDMPGRYFVHTLNDVFYEGVLEFSQRDKPRVKSSITNCNAYKPDGTLIKSKK